MLDEMTVIAMCMEASAGPSHKLCSFGQPHSHFSETVTVCRLCGDERMQLNRASVTLMLRSTVEEYVLAGGLSSLTSAHQPEECVAVSA